MRVEASRHPWWPRQMTAPTRFATANLFSRCEEMERLFYEIVGREEVLSIVLEVLL